MPKKTPEEKERKEELRNKTRSIMSHYDALAYSKGLETNYWKELCI